MTKAQSPFLKGVFAPWRKEGNYDVLEIEGSIPEDLNGVLLRNGPNPQFDPEGSYHWFEGDGMLHAIRIQNGNASYDNRWVRTPRFVAERKAGRALFGAGLAGHDESDVEDVSHETANTNIVRYNRTLLALNEGSQPYAIQLSNLQTVGVYNYQGQINRALSAHPRYDYRRNELMTYSYISEDGKLMYYRLSRMNKIISQKEIDWPYMAMMHDFVTTENYVVFPIFPCTMDFERMMKGGSIFMWEGDRLPAVLIVTDKSGNEVARVEMDPCYAYHFGNAFEQDGNIVIDAMHSQCTALMPDRNGKVAAREDSDARLARWTLDLASNQVKVEFLDDTPVEFPRFDERFNGLPYQHLYTGGRKTSDGLFDRIMHYDLVNKRKVEHSFDGGDVPSEPVFVASGNKEGQGYLLTVVYRTKEDRSDVVILDAQDIAAKSIATIKIPHRIPFGFHGNFIEI